ncbi:MAG: Maf family protein [Dokdonella sp.]
MTPLADIDLILASTSPYRRELLARLTSRIRQIAPEVDESPRPGETRPVLAARLAEAKARNVARQNPGTVVIGSDQVAELGSRTLSKPGNADAAREQLALCSARDAVFHTAVCVIDARAATVETRSAIVTTRVVFRRLDADEIDRYIERDNPLACAGSFKAEALGIALFDRIESDDPTALIGLPLIALCRCLRQLDISVI